MDLLVVAVSHMARRYERATQFNEQEWATDAHYYVTDIPGIAAMGILDKSYAMRSIVSRDGRKGMVGRVMNEEPVRRRLLLEAAKAHETRVSPLIELFDGTLGILIVSPIDRRDEAGGFLVTALRMQGLWNALRMGDSAKGFRVSVSEDSSRLYQSVAAASAAESLAETAAVHLPGVVWTVRAAPPREASIFSPLILPIVLGGATFCILLPLSIALAQAARARARESEAVKTYLETQVQERWRSEEAMRENEERFRLAFGNAPIGMALVTREGRWLRVNDSVCRMLGYSESELLATDFQTLTHPEDLDADLTLLRKVLAGEIDSYSVHKRYFHKSGRSVDVLLYVSYVSDRPGRAGYFVSQLMDISERIAVDRMKSEFISTVSHELRTPLTSIAGSLGLLRGGVAGKLPPKATRLVEIASRNSGRLIRLVDDILYLEKEGAGKLEFELQAQALEPIVWQTIEANQQYTRGFGVGLELTQSCPDVWVRVDRDRLIQVLTNLISNAAKFSPRGATVFVSIHQEGPAVRVCIRDQGPGIPEAFRTRIFQQFAQADSPEVRNKGGTGLGLSIAKLFMERLGGGIGFETAAARGTTFWISLPIEARSFPAEPSRQCVGESA